MIELKDNNSGFTLVEVMVASFLLVAALVPVLNLFITDLYNYKTAGERTQLAAAGRAVLEEIISDEKELARIVEDELKNKEEYVVEGEKYSSDILYDLIVSKFEGSESLLQINVKVYNGNTDERISLTTLRVVR